MEFRAKKISEKHIFTRVSRSDRIDLEQMKNKTQGKEYGYGVRRDQTAEAE